MVHEASQGDAISSYHHYMERAYKYRPVKVIDFDSPRQHCVIYLDLKREEWANHFPSCRVYSQAHLGGKGLFLSAHCNIDQQSSVRCFELFLGMQEKGSAAFTVGYEYASRTKPLEETTPLLEVKLWDLFGMPWTVFIEEDGPIFINGVLHLRAELTVKQ